MNSFLKKIVLVLVVGVIAAVGYTAKMNSPKQKQRNRTMRLLKELLRQQEKHSDQQAQRISTSLCRMSGIALI